MLISVQFNYITVYRRKEKCLTRADNCSAQARGRQLSAVILEYYNYTAVWLCTLSQNQQIYFPISILWF